MPESVPHFRSEDYVNYLTTLARVQLAGAGLVRKKFDCADLVQEVLLQAEVSRAQFRGTTPEEFCAWLRQILANKFLDVARHYRRAKRDAALEVSYREVIEGSASRLVMLSMASQTSPSSYVDRHERGLRLADALATLPEDQRTALELHYLREHSLAEVASGMERTKPSVAGLLRRGLKALRERLEADDA